MEYKGGCHCGAVRFSVRPEIPLELERCNCSICLKSGYLHLIVSKTRFNLICGEEKLKTYTWNSGVAQHYFCEICGIKPFYVPRSNPDGIDINVNCLDEEPKDALIVAFDGKNWEKNAHQLAHKTAEP